MSLHGIDGHAQLICDIFVATARGGMSQNFSVTLGQQPASGGSSTVGLLQRGYHVLSKAIRHEGRMDSFTPVDGSYDAKKLGMVGILENVTTGAGLNRCHNSCILIMDRQHQHLHI